MRFTLSLALAIVVAASAVPAPAAAGWIKRAIASQQHKPQCPKDAKAHTAMAKKR
jgi:hypothetical protein